MLMTDLVKINAVLERLAKLFKTEKDVALASCLGVSRHVLSTWRKRGTVPYEILCEVAAREGFSLDWLLLGRGTPRLEPQENPAIEQELQASLDLLRQTQPLWLEDAARLEPSCVLVKHALKRIATDPESTVRQRDTANVLLQMAFGVQGTKSAAVNDMRSDALEDPSIQ
jgi:hypothetical protein